MLLIRAALRHDVGGISQCYNMWPQGPSENLLMSKKLKSVFNKIKILKEHSRQDYLYPARAQHGCGTHEIMIFITT